MGKIILPNEPITFDGLNCDSEPSSVLENMVKPKVSTDMRKLPGMFPPAFNELRKQLYNNHVDIWEVVSGMMIYNHEYFIESMNNILDCVCDHRMGMQVCCERWLKALETRPQTRRLM